MTGITYTLAPQKIIHAYTEIWVNHEWLALEGVIIDDKLLAQTKNHLSDQGDKLIGYGVSVKKEMDSIPASTESLHLYKLLR